MNTLLNRIGGLALAVCIAFANGDSSKLDPITAKEANAFIKGRRISSTDVKIRSFTTEGDQCVTVALAALGDDRILMVRQRSRKQIEESIERESKAKSVSKADSRSAELEAFVGKIAAEVYLSELMWKVDGQED